MKIEMPWCTMLLLLSIELSFRTVEGFYAIHVPHARYHSFPKSVVSTVHCSTRSNHTDLNGPFTLGISDGSGSGSSTWSVTDNWSQMSQSDNINYNYGNDNLNNNNNSHEMLPVVLNSIDQATLAALRMQNFGMSSSSSSTVPLSEEDIWIQNSIQQIMVIADDDDDDETVDTNAATTSPNHQHPLMEHEVVTAGTLNTKQFLDDMGKEIARLVRCNDVENHSNSNSGAFMDECELFDDSDFSASTTTDKQGKSSYQRVELHNDIPIWMKDGEFVFIDEQSCIGCMQCASAAPGSFQILEQGRARTFCQRNSPDVMSAVASCPVDCMHYVSFDELKELETARDVGVADDHRHFGHSSARGYIPPTPVHISRSDSDANHKSSFYQIYELPAARMLRLSEVRTWNESLLSR